MGKDATSIKAEFNTFRETSMDFKVVQGFRLIIAFFLTLIFLVIFYIFVRMTLMYLNAWTVVLMLATILCVGYASGRMVLEQKMLERRRGAD